jgi:hypothetical protein
VRVVTRRRQRKNCFVDFLVLQDHTHARALGPMQYAWSKSIAYGLAACAIETYYAIVAFFDVPR